MLKYPKIDSLYKRDTQGRMFVGQWANPVFEYLAENEWLLTEKIDGTNVRVHWDGKQASFGGRTDNAQMPTFLFAKLQEMFPNTAFVANYPDYADMTLYGEGYGARIQKGGGNYKPDGVDFCLFDVCIDGHWLDWEAVKDIAGHLDIATAPAYASGDLPDMHRIVQYGFASLIGTATAEGIVARPAVRLYNSWGAPIRAKLKTKDFLRIAEGENASG